MNHSPVSPFQNAAQGQWPQQIHQVFCQKGLGLISYVPDGGHRSLIELCQADAQLRTVSLTTEEEGVALAAGAWLGGQRSALLMQSSGVGNCVNMFSLLKTGQFPFFTLITMRGEYGEFNPWQVPMGQATPQVLQAMGFVVQRANQAETVAETVAAGIDLAYQTYSPVAVLLSQSLLGAKKFGGAP